MAEEGFRRKLTAILSADVEGYSRLMGEDEDATIRTLTAYRQLMSTLIQKHRGRVVDSPGDNLLAEFLSVVDRGWRQVLIFLTWLRPTIQRQMVSWAGFHEVIYWSQK